MSETISDEAKALAFARAMSEAGKRIGTYHSACATCDASRWHWPCHMLISDPVRALADRDAWPSCLSGAVMRESIDRWLAASVYSRKTRGFATVPADWPVPIGTVSLRRELETYNCIESYGELAPILRDASDKYAGLILTANFPNATVTFFGLVIEHEPAADGARTWSFHESLFDVYGLRADDPDALRWGKAARRWWESFRGKPLRRSHNAGRRPLSKAERTRQRLIVRQAEAMYSQAVGVQKQWNHVAAKFGLDENQLRYLRDKVKKEKQETEN